MQNFEKMDDDPVVASKSKAARTDVMRIRWQKLKFATATSLK